MSGNKRIRRMWPKATLLLLLLATLLAPITRAQAQTLPSTEEEALSGEKVNLASALHGKVGILLVGFSKKSGDQTIPWAKELTSEFLGSPTVAVFELPILESAPRFVRGLIVNAMKKDTPPELHARFIPVFHNEKQWKDVAQYATEDDAYLLIVDQQEKVVWRTCGPLEPLRKAAVLAHVRALQH